MIILNGNSVTLVYKGKTFTKELSPEDVAVISIHAQAQDYEEIYNYAFASPLENLLCREGFWESNNSVYYKNIRVSIPQVLATKLKDANDEEFERLIRFWGWLSLNPNPRTRESLYGWVEKNNIQVTNGGLMILYRRIVSCNKNNELTEFVKETYERLRTQKKSTNVMVYCDVNEGEYTLKQTSDSIGYLKALYNNVDSNPVQFTDAHTGREDYRIGKESSMKREDGDESSNTCSAG